MVLGFWCGYVGFIFMGLEGWIWGLCLESLGCGFVESIFGLGVVLVFECLGVLIWEF